jgi:hypothetical protein
MPDPFGRSTVFVPIRAFCCGDDPFTSLQEIKFVRAHQPYTRALGPTAPSVQVSCIGPPGRADRAGSHQAWRSRAVGSKPASSWSAAAARPRQPLRRRVPAGALAPSHP